MKNQKRIGHCSLCGELTALTFEHVPPQKAFNSIRIKKYSMHTLLNNPDRLPWDKSDLESEIIQQGMGYYSLCAKCNNNTGTRYASSYVNFVSQTFSQIAIMQQKTFPQQLNLELTNIYPLRIAKQILTMFISINPPGFINNHPRIYSLIMNRNKREDITDQYNLYVYLVKIWKHKHNGTFGIIDNNKIITAGELDAPPFGFLIDFNSHFKEKAINITDWLYRFDFDERVDMKICIPFRDTISDFPYDYRTKDEILNYNQQ